MQTKILSTINSPTDLKKLRVEHLKILAEEIRSAILNKVSQVGGHVGPNLGVVELTIAFHYLFDSPKDKIVWDVSHQAYPHKILTGRKNGFLDETEFHSVSGYTTPEESEHDFFKVGHTSTSVSLAVGLAKARDLKHESGNVLAVIGDGSLSGGLAFEGFNNGALLHSNLIVIVNDNEMSIDENQGGLYKSLAELRESNGTSPNNFFKAMGFDYQYVEDGNDLETMLAAFEKVKDVGHPLVLHVHTEKGHGYVKATEEKMNYHWRSPFNLETGESLFTSNEESYNSIIMDYLEQRLKNNQKDFVAINAAIPGMFGLNRFASHHPDRYFDVGIAEGHSVSFAAGLAKNGIRPILFHSSYFLPRAYDQLSHDLAINKLPAVIIVGGGHIGQSDETHQGVFDIPMIKSIPDINYLAPTSKEELLAMLEWSLNQTEGPVAIRLPVGKVVARKVERVNYAQPDYEFLKNGSKVAILALGAFLSLGEQVSDILKNELAADVTLINPRSITQLDKDSLESLKKAHELVITLEDGSLAGGFGESIAAFYGDSSVIVLNYGATKEFTDNIPLAELYHRYHLNCDNIVEDVMEFV